MLGGNLRSNVFKLLIVSCLWSSIIPQQMSGCHMDSTTDGSDGADSASMGNRCGLLTPTMSALEHQQLARERRRILNLLNLKEPPTILPGEEEAAEYLADIESTSDSGSEEALGGQLQSPTKVFIVGQKVSPCSRSHCHCYRFDMQNSMGRPDATVVDAVLHVGKHLEGIKVEVDILMDGEWISIQRDKLKPETFDLTEEMKRIPSSALSGALPPIRVSCLDGCGDMIRPVIAMRVDLSDSIRSRRGIEENCDHGGCCLRSFYFNFSENSWNKWIIKPEGYHLNYCSGHCAVGNQFASARDIIATIANLGGDDDKNTAHAPCCTPTAYRSLTIRYTAGFGVYRERVLNDIIVKECGCRQ